MIGQHEQAPRTAGPNNPTSERPTMMSDYPPAELPYTVHFRFTVFSMTRQYPTYRQAALPALVAGLTWLAHALVVSCLLALPVSLLGELLGHPQSFGRAILISFLLLLSKLFLKLGVPDVSR
ncbi:hypothetical protein D5S17_35500 [Pseudonocardiaceae bacterium YIM PH 21723]|nr:hypothetical protein D5S17_35500 [Pseudonocardiaceae bacterium YIM PH 21723]